MKLKIISGFAEDIRQDELILFQYVSDGDIQSVLNLLSTGIIDVDARDHKGEQLPTIMSSAIYYSQDIPLKCLGLRGLDYACYDGNAVMALHLINLGADPNKANTYGRTPLHWATNRGHTNVVQLLLWIGADPNKADLDGLTPLHEATMVKEKSIVEDLLKGGADPNKEDENGKTPLYHAEENGYQDIARTLLDSGSESVGTV